MKNIKRYLCLLIAMILLLSLTSCNPQLPEDVQAKFDKFLEEEFVDYVTSDTLTLHYTLKDSSKYDIKEFEPTLGDFSIEELEKNNKDIANTLKQLKSFDYYSLSKDQKLTYDILEKYLETEEKSKDFTYYYSILSPTIGLQANLPITLAEYKFYDKDDIDDYISLIKEVGPYFDNIITYEKEKSKKGLFMSDFAVDDIVEQCTKFISSPKDNYLIITFNNKVDSIGSLSAEEKEQYKVENEKVILNSLIPAYENLINEINKLKGTGTNNGGLCNFPDGDKYYEYLVESTTGSDKSVNKMKKTLENRLTNLFAEMNTIINKSPDVLSVFGQNNYESNDPNIILDSLKERIKDYYPKAPTTNYEIRYVDKSLEENLSPAFYLIPPIDDYKSNVVYINNSQVDNVSLFPTLAHEGYPGHLYQVTYFNSTNPNPIRNTISFGGYTEGWATYAEIQSYELANLNNEPLTKLSQVYAEITLAIPTVIDIGVNYEGWTLKETEEYLTSFGFDSSAAESLYNSVIEEPANYLKYYIGYLEFVELRDKAKDKLGKKFDLKAFNKVVLDVGPAPFSILEDKVDNYIKNTK